MVYGIFVVIQSIIINSHLIYMLKYINHLFIIIFQFEHIYQSNMSKIYELRKQKILNTTNNQNINDQNVFQKLSKSNLSRECIIINRDPEDGKGCCNKCLQKIYSCGQLEYLQPYFNVTTQTIKSRIYDALQFWNSDFLKLEEDPDLLPPIQQKGQGQNQITQSLNNVYELYGPFWILSTLIFLLGAVPNILLYQVLEANDFKYNFNIIGISFASIYSLGFGFPILLTFIMKCFAGAPQYLTYMCVISMYGYSQSASIFCILLCCINFQILHYIIISYAILSRSCFLILNIRKINLTASRRILIIGFILLENLVMFIMFKFVFVKTVSPPTKTTTSHLFHNIHI